VVDPAAEPPLVELLGIPIHAVREAECVATIIARATAGQGGWVVTPNLDHLRRLVHDAPFRSLCARADLRVADGMPLVWASRLRGTPLPERVAGSNLIVSLSEAAAGAGLPVFLLGGDPGTAEGAAGVLRRRFPGLVVAGTSCPAPGFDSDPDRLRELAERLAAAAPRIVFVALGSPKQELLIDRLRSQLPAAWWLGVGISFSFLTGAVRRAPAWLQRAGGEWLHRLAQERSRLARRYLLHGIPFACRLFLHSARERFRPHRGP
jgi:N-acetylglucosaminyldiphosphoundecaprenol N-acetyl-beta-D-mannosaminyltransferase